MEEQKTKTKTTHPSKLNEIGREVEKIAIKTAESIRKAIDRALASRNTVLTIRVNDECNTKLNMLVESGLFKSRSESAAYLIQEGIKSQEPLFLKITDKLKKVEEIKKELRNIISGELEPLKSGKSEDSQNG